MTEDGYVPVNPRRSRRASPTFTPSAICARQGTPKAGVFAEGAARAVATALIARLRGSGGTGDPHGNRLVLHRVRRRADRPRGRGLLLQSRSSDRHLLRAVGRAARRQGAFRFEPPRPLVRTLTVAPVFCKLSSGDPRPERRNEFPHGVTELIENPVAKPTAMS